MDPHYENIATACCDGFLLMCGVVTITSFVEQQTSLSPLHVNDETASSENDIEGPILSYSGCMNAMQHKPTSL